MNTVRVTTPSETEIVLTRGFDAPRRLVFDAWTKPELLRQWFGARGWHLVVCEIDLRVGGAWRFVSRGPGGADMGHGGVYREISAPDRLVYTESYDDQWFPGEALVTTVLTEDGGRTTMTSTLLFPSREVRDLVLASPMERGVGEGYDRLAELLAQQRKDVTA
ncbi:SRPBCC family protein [Amycolatopsis anabasis]|uniref:SRPBCC family protein n=1 Tax=Amycolatopsis anabasis TaxID=1840409 RepID=UPI00131B4E10|nr:SRPBCC family protein [Amycolatopsis anabasis]